MVTTTRWGTEIDDECVRIAYSQLRTAASTAIISAVVMVLLTRSYIPIERQLGWAGAVIAFAAARLALVRRFQARPRVGAELRRWSRWLLVVMVIAGAIFGSLVLLSRGPAPLLLIAVCTLAVSGHISGGSQALAGTPIVLVAAAAAAVAPLSIAMLRAREPDVSYLALITTLYLGSVVAMVRQHNHALRASLALRFDNLDLAERLSQRVIIETELRAAAEQAGQDKTRFLAAASHDLRQPLQALVLFTSALGHEAHSARGRHLCDRIEVSIDTLRTLLDGLLDISRLDAGVVTPRPAPVATAAIARQVETVFGDLAASRGLRLRVIASDAWILADPDMVGQMVRNLVANAIRYTARGGIIVAFRRRGPRIRVEVWDTGVGIAPEHQREVFREFVQVGNPERDRSKGVGLGLAIVDRLARLQGARIEVASQLGRGSRFWFELPGTPAPGAGAAAATTSAVPTPAACAAPRTVLLLDDDGIAREGLTAALEAWGFRVEAAADIAAAAAIATARAAELDAVICDFRLPGGATAVDALAAITAAAGRRLPSLIVTGETDPLRIRAAHATGHPVLFKPVPPSDLRASLATALAQTSGAPAAR